jgi:hypothetical protein
MPGFNICGSGGQVAATIETRRKHRWVFQTLGRGGGTFSEAELLVLMSAQRPNFKFEEPEMHHNQEVAYFAGKQSWEPITLTWYDTQQDPDVSAGIYAWLETVVNFASANVNPPSVYKKQATLAMVDGSGQASETWTICNTWPKEVNWGDLDYTSTEIATIEATMRYDRALKSCVAAPAPQTFGPSCGIF